MSAPDTRSAPTATVPLPNGDPREAAARDADAALGGLALKLQAGDAPALATLHERLQPAIRAALGRILRGGLPDPLAPDDVQQQTWITLAEIARRWSPTGSFLAYFSQSFERDLRRYVARARPVRGKRAVRVTSVPHDDLVAAIERINVADNGPEHAALLQEQLALLSDPERTAVVLHVLEEQDFGAIGRHLKVSRATAHRLCRRGLARLGEVS